MHGSGVKKNTEEKQKSSVPNHFVDLFLYGYFVKVDLLMTFWWLLRSLFEFLGFQTLDYLLKLELNKYPFLFQSQAVHTPVSIHPHFPKYPVLWSSNSYFLERHIFKTKNTKKKQQKHQKYPNGFFCTSRNRWFSNSGVSSRAVGVGFGRPHQAPVVVGQPRQPRLLGAIPQRHGRVPGVGVEQLRNAWGGWLEKM